MNTTTTNTASSDASPSSAINQSYAVVTSPDTARIERLLPGPIERVWEFLVDSDKRGKWFARGPMEQRLGGALTLHFLHQTLSAVPEPLPAKYADMAEGHTGHATITIFEPPHRLAFTWMEEEAPPSEVTFDLQPQGSNVLFTITHQRLAKRADVISVASGWHGHLNVLIDLLNETPPRPFWSTIMRLEDEYEAIVPASPQ